MIGGYKLQDRGPVQMKGKGTINTYFLYGEKGFTKSLPDLNWAASMHEHEFKQNTLFGTLQSEGESE